MPFQFSQDLLDAANAEAQPPPPSPPPPAAPVVASPNVERPLPSVATQPPQQAIDPGAAPSPVEAPEAATEGYGASAAVQPTVAPPPADSGYQFPKELVDDALGNNGFKLPQDLIAQHAREIAGSGVDPLQAYVNRDIEDPDVAIQAKRIQDSDWAQKNIFEKNFSAWQDQLNAVDSFVHEGIPKGIAELPQMGANINKAGADVATLIRSGKATEEIRANALDNLQQKKITPDEFNAQMDLVGKLADLDNQQSKGTLSNEGYQKQREALVGPEPEGRTPDQQRAARELVAGAESVVQGGVNKVTGAAKALNATPGMQVLNAGLKAIPFIGPYAGGEPMSQADQKQLLDAGITVPSSKTPLDMSDDELKQDLAVQRAQKANTDKLMTGDVGPIGQAVMTGMNGGKPAMSLQDLAASGNPVDPGAIEGASTVANMIGLAMGGPIAEAGEGLGALGLKSASQALRTGSVVTEKVIGKGFDAAKRYLGWGGVDLLMHPGNIIPVAEHLGYLAAAQGGAKIGKWTADLLEDAATDSLAGRGIVAQLFGRTLKSAASGAGTNLLLAMPSTDPVQLGAAFSSGAALGGAFGLPKDTATSVASGTFDSAFIRRGKEPTYEPPDTPYGTDPALDKQSAKAIKELPDEWKNRVNGVKQLLGDKAEVYVLPPKEFSVYAEQGAATNQISAEQAKAAGVTIKRPEGGAPQVFLNAEKVHKALYHETGHALYHYLPEEARLDFKQAYLEHGDADQLVQNYVKRYTDQPNDLKFSDLPTEAQVQAGARRGPAGLTQETALDEMAADRFHSLFNGQSVDQLTRDPSLARRMQFWLGRTLERFGIPTTTAEAAGILGVRPQFTDMLVLDQFVRKGFKDVPAPTPDASVATPQPAAPPAGPAPAGPAPLPSPGARAVTPAAPVVDPAIVAARNDAVAAMRKLGIPLADAQAAAARSSSTNASGILQDAVSEIGRRRMEQKAPVMPPPQPATVPQGVPTPEGMPTARAAQPAAPSAPEVSKPVQGFTTGKGSTYVVHEDGTTTRTKAARPEHPGDEGLKDRSERTVYLKPEDAARLAPPNGVPTRFVDHGDGTISVVAKVKDRWGVSPSQRNVPVAKAPAEGLMPLELWKKDSTFTEPAYSTHHFGNPIKSLEARVPAPRFTSPEAPTMPSNRAPVVAPPPPETKRAPATPETPEEAAYRKALEAAGKPEPEKVTAKAAPEPAEAAPKAGSALTTEKPQPIAAGDVQRAWNQQHGDYPATGVFIDSEGKYHVQHKGGDEDILDQRALENLGLHGRGAPVQGNATAGAINARLEDPTTAHVDKTTWFGLNENGGPDPGDKGDGYFGKYTRDPALVGASLPWRTLAGTIGDFTRDPAIEAAIRRGDYKIRITADNGKTVDAVIADVGPAEWTRAGLDVTYGTGKALGLRGNEHTKFQIIGADGKPLELRSAPKDWVPRGKRGLPGDGGVHRGGGTPEGEGEGRGESESEPSRERHRRTEEPPGLEEEPAPTRKREETKPEGEEPGAEGTPESKAEPASETGRNRQNLEDQEKAFTSAREKAREAATPSERTFQEQKQAYNADPAGHADTLKSYGEEDDYNLGHAAAQGDYLAQHTLEERYGKAWLAQSEPSVQRAFSENRPTDFALHQRRVKIGRQAEETARRMETQEASGEAEAPKLDVLQGIQRHGGLPGLQRLKQLEAQGETMGGEVRRVYDAWHALSPDAKAALKRDYGITSGELFSKTAPPLDLLRNDLAQTSDLIFDRSDDLLSHVEDLLSQYASRPPAPPAPKTPPVTAGPSAVPGMPRAQVAAPVRPKAPRGLSKADVRRIAKEAADAVPEVTATGKPKAPAKLADDRAKAVHQALLKAHADRLGEGDDRVRLQVDPETGRQEVSGTRFVAGDAVHERLLAGVPSQAKAIADQFSQRIGSNQPVHLTYHSAEAADGGVQAPTAESRGAEQAASPASERAKGATPSTENAVTVIPTSLGVSLDPKKGNAVYLKGFSPNKFLTNVAHLVEALKERSPYDSAHDPKLAADVAKYVENQRHGWKGDGSAPLQGTPELQVQVARGYAGKPLPKKHADFINAAMNDHSARGTTAKAGAIRTLTELNRGHLTPKGETNPLREEINDTQFGDVAEKLWTKKTLQSPYETRRADLVKELHDAPPLDKPSLYEHNPDVAQAFTEHGLPVQKYVAAGFLPDAHPENRYRDDNFMPVFAGERAGGFSQAQKDQRTFASPYDQKPRFEVSDKNLRFKTPAGEITPLESKSALADSMKPMRLEDAIRHPQLFEQYPFLKDLTVKTSDAKKPGHADYKPPESKPGEERGERISKAGLITLSTDFSKEDLVHEIQHAIQDYEGRTFGSSSSMASARLDVGKLRQEAYDQWDRENPLRGDYFDYSYGEHEARKKARQDFANHAVNTQAWNEYRRNAGEIEAREAADRSWMGKSDLDKRPPYDPASPGYIPPEKAWFLPDAERVNDTREKAHAEGRALFLPDSKDEPVRRLVALHNTSAEGVLAMDRLGGVPVPSIAITKKTIPFDQFGPITLVAHPDVVDPKKGTPVFDRDIYSPTQPRPSTNYNYDHVAAKTLENKVQQAIHDLYGRGSIHPNAISYLLEHDNNPAHAASELSTQLAFLKDVGEAPDLTPNKFGRLSLEDSNALRDALQKNGGQKAVERWIKDSLQPAESEPYFQNKSGEVRPYTLEEVTRHMRGKIVNAEGDDTGLRETAAKAATRFLNVPHMHENTHRLGTTRAEDEHLDETNRQIDKLQRQLEHSGGGSAQEDFMKSVADFNHYSDRKLAQLGDAEAAKRSLDRNGFDTEEITPDLVRRFRTVAARVGYGVTPFFEAKPQRAVQLKEFNAAVYPEGTHPEVIRALHDAGVNHHETYRDNTPDREEDRRAAVERAAEATKALFLPDAKREAPKVGERHLPVPGMPIHLHLHFHGMPAPMPQPEKVRREQ